MWLRPTALGWIDYDVSTAPKWEEAQVQRLARRLGYVLVWPRLDTLLPLPDQIRDAGVDAMILPTLDHLGPLELDSVMHIADVETVLPRLTFARWAMSGLGR